MDNYHKMFGNVTIAMNNSCTACNRFHYNSKKYFFYNTSTGICWNVGNSVNKLHEFEHTSVNLVMTNSKMCTFYQGMLRMRVYLASSYSKMLTHCIILFCTTWIVKKSLPFIYTIFWLGGD